MIPFVYTHLSVQAFRKIIDETAVATGVSSEIRLDDKWIVNRRGNGAPIIRRLVDKKEGTGRSIIISLPFPPGKYLARVDVIFRPVIFDGLGHIPRIFLFQETWPGGGR